MIVIKIQSRCNTVVSEPINYLHVRNDIYTHIAHPLPMLTHLMPMPYLCVYDASPCNLDFDQTSDAKLCHDILLSSSQKFTHLQPCDDFFEKIPHLLASFIFILPKSEISELALHTQSLWHTIFRIAIVPSSHFAYKRISEMQRQSLLNNDIIIYIYDLPFLPETQTSLECVPVVKVSPCVYSKWNEMTVAGHLGSFCSIGKIWLCSPISSSSKNCTISHAIVLYKSSVHKTCT